MQDDKNIGKLGILKIAREFLNLLIKHGSVFQEYSTTVEVLSHGRDTYSVVIIIFDNKDNRSFRIYDFNSQQEGSDYSEFIKKILSKKRIYKNTEEIYANAIGILRCC